MRGVSALVRDAIDLYLEHEESEKLEAVLALRGALTADEADDLEGQISEAWSPLLP